MANIANFLNSGNVTIAVNPVDLQEFADYLLAKAKEQAEAEKQVETYLSPEEAAKLIGVSRNTLWRWEKNHYLVPVKVGRFPRYKRSDIDNLVSGQVVKIEERGQI